MSDSPRSAHRPLVSIAVRDIRTGERLSKALRATVPSADIVLLLAEYGLREHGASGRGRLSDVLIVDRDMARLVLEIGPDRVSPLIAEIVDEAEGEAPLSPGFVRIALASEPRPYSTACAWVAGAVAAISRCGIDGRTREDYEKRYEDLVNALPDIVYQLNVDGTIEFINESVASLGYSPEELVGKHFSVLLYDDDAAAVDRDKVLPDFAGYSTGLALSPKLFNERRSVERRTADLEVRLRRKSGSHGKTQDYIGSVISYGEISAAGEYGHGSAGGFRGSVGIIRDVTLRRKAEETLRKLYQAIDQLGTSVFILNHAFEVEYVNPAFIMLAGFAPMEVIGQNIFRFLAFPPDKCSAMERTVLEGFEVKDEVPIPRSNGGEFWARLHLAPVRSPTGAIMHAVAIADDVSAARALDESVRNAKAEVEEANRGKARFIAMTARELRKPIEDIVSSASRQTSQDDGPGSIRYDAGILADVLGAMLDYVRSEPAEGELKPRPFRLGSFMTKRCAPFGRRARSLGLGFELSIGDDGAVECDPDRLGRIVGLAIDDALARLESGKVNVSASIERRPGNVAHILVRVASDGQEAEGERGRRDESLKLARTIAKVMGGEVRSSGSGGEFDATLIVPAEAPVSDELKPAARYSVLVVDDNEINLEYMRTLLENAGFRVLVADGADEALRVLETRYVDAALIDLRMPGMDGAELGAAIRSYKGGRFSPAMPLFAMTAHDAGAFVAAGGPFRLTFPKPADLRLVATSIAEAMAELEPSAPAASVADGADGDGRTGSAETGADRSAAAASAAVAALSRATSGATEPLVDVKAEASTLAVLFRQRGDTRGQELVGQFVEHYADEDRDVLAGLVERIGQLALRPSSGGADGRAAEAPRDGVS